MGWPAYAIPLPWGRLPSPITFEPSIVFLNFSFTLESITNLFAFDNLLPPFRFAQPSVRSEEYFLARLCIDVDSTHPLVRILDEHWFGGIPASNSHFHSINVFLHFLCLFYLFFVYDSVLHHSETTNRRDTTLWYFESAYIVKPK